jgi:hypothetical protein
MHIAEKRFDLSLARFPSFLVSRKIFSRRPRFSHFDDGTYWAPSITQTV